MSVNTKQVKRRAGPSKFRVARVAWSYGSSMIPCSCSDTSNRLKPFAGSSRIACECVRVVFRAAKETPFNASFAERKAILLDRI